MDTLARLTAHQTSLLDGYRFQVHDDQDRLVGRVDWPMMSQARNARLRWHGDDPAAGAVRITVDGQPWRMEFAFLDRGWVNDTRYILVGPDGEAASAEHRFPRGRIGGGELRLVVPGPAVLVRRKRCPRQCFAFVQDQRELGRIEEPRALSLRRRLRADLPADWSVPVRIFALTLTLNAIVTSA